MFKNAFPLLLIPACALAACSSSVKQPTVADGPYQGPVLTVDSSGKFHTVVVQAPSPGWVITLDRINEAHRHEDVFLSITKPDPRFLYSTQMVEQRLQLPLPSATVLRVCARVRDFDANDDTDYFTVIEPKP